MKKTPKISSKRTPDFLTSVKSSFDTTKRSVLSWFGIGKKYTQKNYRKVAVYVNKHPLKSFYIMLGVFVLLIILSSLFRTSPATESKKALPIKPVQVYHIGSGPSLTYQAQIEKTGVVKITALTSGVVQKINFREGEEVQTGSQLVQISTNYQGGNAASTQRAIAQEQYNTAVANYDTQKDAIGKRREIADKTDTNADRLREIKDESLSETRSLIDINEDILDALDAEIQNPPPNKTREELQGQKATVLSGLNQARQALRSAEYEVSGDNPPAQLSDLERDKTKRQLDVEERVLNMNKEISRLSLQLAQISEAAMFPSSPFNGVIQKVFVKEGEAVLPGTTLVVIAQTKDDPITAIAYVPRDIAMKVSSLSESTLHIANKVYKTYPSYVSVEAVSGGQYAIYYDIPEEYTRLLTEQGYITVDVPVGIGDTLASVAFIPIDAVYQTAEASYVFVNKNNRAESRQVLLGDVYGEFVQVEKGLGNGDSVIVSRNILSGEKVEESK